MNMIHVARRVVIVAALASLLLGPQLAPVAANPADWVTAPCATAAITGHTVEQVKLPVLATRVRLTGWVEPCAAPPADATFATLTYTARQADFPMTRSPLRAYRTTPGPTTFAATVDLPTADLSEFDQPQAHCVLLSRDVRLACVGIDTGGQPRVTTVFPIAPDDVRVRDVPVVATPTTDRTPDPVCGTCV